MTLMKEMMSTAISGMLSIVLLGGVAAAQSNTLSSEIVSDPAKPIANFDTDKLIPILQEMGLSLEGREDDNGSRLLIAKTANGLNFNIFPSACLSGINSGCVGLQMIALFPEAPQREVNSFNYRYQFASVGVDPTSDASYVSRYIIADYGIPKGNVASNVYNYIGLLEKYRQTLYSARNTVSLKADPDDLAAGDLNRQAALQNKMAAAMLDDRLGIHQDSMEETTKLVKMLVKADRLSEGKIINDLKAPK